MSNTGQLAQFDVSAQSETDTRAAVETRNFEFVVDEPPSLGGTDDGPNPVEYLLGAWAGCLNVVAHVVADEYDLVLDGLEIEIEGSLDPAAFLGESDDSRAGYQHVDVALVPETDADEESLATWAEEVERRCPVGDNIQNSTPTTVAVTTD